MRTVVVPQPVLNKQHQLEQLPREYAELGRNGQMLSDHQNEIQELNRQLVEVNQGLRLDNAQLVEQNRALERQNVNLQQSLRGIQQIIADSFNSGAFVP
jgi:hypothetical protein